MGDRRVWRAISLVRIYRNGGPVTNAERQSNCKSNDHTDIRQAFDGFHIETVDIRYTVGSGGREALRKEMIIFSWDESREPVGLF